jgi:hypothetical protein
MVPDDVHLLRLAWHPAHFPNDELDPALAFDSADLRGDNGRFLSVDRLDLVSQRAVDARIEQLKKDGKDERLKRREAKFINFNCGELRAASDADGMKPFQITTEEEEDNAAHCAVRNISGKRNPSYINELRTILVSRIQEYMSYSDIFNEKT